MDLERELKELQIQYDKVCHERNELKKENRLLKKDLKEYQAYIKKGVEEHYKDFMQDYDVLLEEYEELMKANEKLKKDLEVLETLKRHSTRLDDEDWNNNIFNGIDYENLDEKERKIIKEWLENDLVL